MSIYMKRRLYLEASQKKSGGDLIFKRGEKDIMFDALDELSECGLRKIALDIPTVDLDLMDGEQITTGRIVYIETDTDISVKFVTTGDTPIDVKPIVAASSDLAEKPGVFYLEGEFSHVYISVAGVSGTANLMVGILGA